MSSDDNTAYGASWYAATMVDEPRRPRLAVDLDVDVCVVGGGLAGLTTAREIARAGWSVVLLEAKRLAGSASGRNTGFVLPGFAADAEALIARVGFERTKSLWDLSQAGLEYVREAVQEEGFIGIDPRDGWLYVSKVENADGVRDYARLLSDLGTDVETWPTERVRAVLRSERYFQAIHYLRAIHIHPLNYALSLAAAAERDGARIFEDTPALSVDPAGVRKRIVTPSARLRANHVVLAGNVQIGGLLPRLGATLLPITTYVITTAPLGPELHEAIAYSGAVSDTDLADNHYRIVGGDRLMLSGRATTWVRNPRRYIRALKADIAKTYPQLGKVAVDYAWAGTLGNTVHRMPQIGELAPGVWLASGFGGHGLNTTAMAGNLIARAIVAGDETWKQFTPFELVWAGGIAGRAAVQMRVWVKRLRDALAERRAKARERVEHQADHADLTVQHQEIRDMPNDVPVALPAEPVLPYEPPPMVEPDAPSAADSIVPDTGRETAESPRSAEAEPSPSPVAAAEDREAGEALPERVVAAADAEGASAPVAAAEPASPGRSDEISPRAAIQRRPRRKKRETRRGISDKAQ